MHLNISKNQELDLNHVMQDDLNEMPCYSGALIFWMSDLFRGSWNEHLQESWSEEAVGHSLFCCSVCVRALGTRHLLLDPDAS